METSGIDINGIFFQNLFTGLTRSIVAISTKNRNNRVIFNSGALLGIFFPTFPHNPLILSPSFTPLSPRPSFSPFCFVRRRSSLVDSRLSHSSPVRSSSTCPSSFSPSVSSSPVLTRRLTPLSLVASPEFVTKVESTRNDLISFMHDDGYCESWLMKEDVVS